MAIPKKSSNAPVSLASFALLAAKAKSATGSRGKFAESRVREHLVILANANMNFTFNRNLDAHAAGGRFPAQAGDYQAFLKEKTRSRNFILEVKELKHDFRLPRKNYSDDKVARVQTRVLAGTEALVLICHWPNTPQTFWRAVPFSVFLEKPTSWDLSAYPPINYHAALNEFFGVTP